MSAASEPGEARACVYVRVPTSLKRMVERDARAAGLSVNSYAMRCLEASIKPRAAPRRAPAPAAVVPLFRGGDERCETLQRALLGLIYERASGLPVPLVLGVLRLVEHHLIKEQTNE